MAQNEPNMQDWTDAWHNADAEGFKNIYAKTALVFPPNKPTVEGNDNILAFMKGGLGKLDVFFESESLIVSDRLAFEFGVFKDVDLTGEKVLGEGKYSVTWVWEDKEWKIQCHTWSMPNK